MTISISQHPFFVKNCSLASIATGDRAGSLFELREKLTMIDESCIYHHFWGARMKAQFLHPQHHNDFAHWTHHRLHDHILSEKLSIIDPTEFDTLEALRQEVIETVEARLDDYDIVLSTKKEDQFHFIRSTIIIFDSSFIVHRPEDLPNMIEMLSPNSIFYHFIDARSRTSEKMDDFSVWLKMFGDQYKALIEEIQSIDPYFLSLTQLRDELTKVIRSYFNARG